MITWSVLEVTHLWKP